MSTEQLRIIDINIELYGKPLLTETMLPLLKDFTKCEISVGNNYVFMPMAYTSLGLQKYDKDLGMMGANKIDDMLA